MCHIETAQKNVHIKSFFIEIPKCVSWCAADRMEVTQHDAGMFCRSLLAAYLRWFGASSGQACHLGSVYSGRWDSWEFSRSPSKWNNESIHMKSKTAFRLNEACNTTMFVCIFLQSSVQTDKQSVISFCQILGLPQEPGCVPHELHEVHHQPAVSALSLHRGVCFAGDAAFRGEVSEACQNWHPESFQGRPSSLFLIRAADFHRTF